MAIHIDPVCGKEVSQSAAGVQALLSQHEGRTYYFCSMACKQEFDRNRGDYVMAQDVVCGRDLDPEEADAQGLFYRFEGKHYRFCSQECRERFVLTPSFYRRVNQQPGGTVAEGPPPPP